MTGRRKCIECGYEFVYKRKDQIYCSQKCCKKASMRNYNDKLKAETTGARIREAKPLPVNNRDLVETAVKARQAGMSYGNYVAQTEYKPVIIMRQGRNS